MRKVISKDIQDNADTYIGRKGDIWISEDNTKLRVGDNTTPGGVEICVGSASSLTDGNASVTVNSDGNVVIGVNGGEESGGSSWQFGNDGDLTLPQGSYIDETAAPLGTAKSLDLHPGNPIYPTQYLRIYPTNGGDADHLHLTSGDLTATELFLGDDEQYVKLTNTGNVEIRTGVFDYYNSTKGVWTFDSDGALTLPTHNATPGSRIKSAVDITIETGPYYLVDLVTVGGGSGGGIGVVDFLISSAPDWETQVAVGDHVVSGTWTQIITAISNLGGGRWRVEFASEDFTGVTNAYSFYKPGAAGGEWQFGADGFTVLPKLNLSSTAGSSIQIGGLAYERDPVLFGVSIGFGAGQSTQQDGSIAIGTGAGGVNQQQYAVSLGQLAGQINQGNSAIAIGQQAGANNQADNSIVINATGSSVQNTVPNTVVIKPMRSVNITTGFYQVYYNPTTGEMVYYQP